MMCFRTITDGVYAMPLLQNELARWKNGQLELRPEPLRVRWSFDDLVTADGHALRCVFTCSALGLADPTERRMLQEVLLLSRTSVTDQDLASHFTRALKAAAEKIAEGQAVNHLLGDDGKHSLCEAMRTAGRPVAFACGVELLPPFHVDVESPTLQQQRQRAVQRSLAEQVTAAQVEHMQRAGELLKQFQEMRKAEGGASAGQTLQQINPADRGSVLQKLLLASASREARPKELMAVAGPYLVRVKQSDDGAAPGASSGSGNGAAAGAARVELAPLPATLGPLRSVQGAEVDGRAVLLVGARNGFLMVARDGPVDVKAFADPQMESEFGFSRVLYLGPRYGFAACHKERGVVFWHSDKPGEPSRAVRTIDLGVAEVLASKYSNTAEAIGAGGPRNLVALDDGAVCFSVGSTLLALTADGSLRPLMATGSDSDVVAIVPDGGRPHGAERDGGRLHAVHEDGTVATIDRATLEVVAKQKRGRRVRAAGALPWLGEVRLLLAGDDGPVDCVGADDSLVTHYASAHHGLRAVAGSAALVAGLSGDRQRLVLWNSWDGRKPSAEIHLAGVAKHRGADVAFV